MFKIKKTVLAIVSLIGLQAVAGDELSNYDFSKKIEKESEENKAIEENIEDLDLSVIDLDEILSPDLLEEDEKIKELRVIIEKLDSNYKNARISKMDEFDLFYEVKSKGKTLYITEDGKYIVPTIAKIYGSNFEDIQKEKKEIEIKKLIEDYDKGLTVSYPATTKKIDTIYAFSDFTCPVCRRLHSELDTINEMGIEVIYIPYPRMGSKDKPALLGLQKIMCSSKPYEEFDLAFQNPKSFVRSITSINSNCSTGKIAIHESLTLGDKVDLRGTPLIYSENGVYLGGWKGINTFKMMYEAQTKRKSLLNGEEK